MTRPKGRLSVWIAASFLASLLFFWLVCLSVNSTKADGMPSVGLFDASNYNTYTLQAERWWQGKLDLGTNYAHLEIAEYNGRYYCSFPPVPSVPLLLLTPLFSGTDAFGSGIYSTPDRLIGFLYLYVGCLMLALFLRRHMADKHAFFWAFFAGMGSNLLSVDVFAGVWFMAQSLSFALCCAALWAIDSPHKKAWPWSFVFWALAVGCRPLQALYLPVLLILLFRNQRLPLGKWLCQLPRFLLAPAGIALCYCWLNYARFGNPLEFGHSYLPEMLNAPHGQFNPYYMFVRGDNCATSNLASVLRWPSLSDYDWSFSLAHPLQSLGDFFRYKLHFPSHNGFFYPLANPIFISMYLSLFGFIGWKRRHRDPLADIALPDVESASQAVTPRFSRCLILTALALTVVHMAALLCHTTNGGWHFGVRYFCDAIPFLMLLLFARKRTAPRWADIALAVFALAFQWYGTLGWLGQWWLQTA